MNLPFKFNSDGLIPAIVQESDGSSEHASGRVLMMAWMNELAISKTVETGLMHYWSRSRAKLWLKGETSGHTQRLVRWFVDCDADTLLFEVQQESGACHTGYESCFFQELDRQAAQLPIGEAPLFNPKETYGS